jgi:predicted ATP-dependent serine protease
MARQVRESAAKLGFKRAIVPKVKDKIEIPQGLHVERATRVSEALTFLFS